MIPKSWKLVPIEPTKEMVNAAYYSAFAEDADGVWNDMLEAIPSPPSEADETLGDRLECLGTQIAALTDRK